MTPEQAMAERMDGDYTPPILTGPTQDQPIPEWDPAQTTLPRKA